MHRKNVASLWRRLYGLIARSWARWVSRRRRRHHQAEGEGMGAEKDTRDEGTSVEAETAQASASAPSPSAVGESNYDDGRESIDVVSERGRSSSVTGGGERRQDFEGRPPRNEDDVLEVCELLREVRRQKGEIWGPFSISTTRTDDVDAVAKNDAGEELKVQVTRVEQEAWERLGRAGQATLQRSVQDLADAIRAAAESKGDPSPLRRKGIPRAQRRNLVLALDAIRSPGYVHESVVAAFLVDHGAWAAGLGFQAIWLVGPTTPLTRQLWGG